jgi:hypothetical protein
MRLTIEINEDRGGSRERWWFSRYDDLLGYPVKGLSFKWRRLFLEVLWRQK